MKSLSVHRARRRKTPPTTLEVDGETLGSSPAVAGPRATLQKWASKTGGAAGVRSSHDSQGAGRPLGNEHRSQLEATKAWGTLQVPCARGHFLSPGHRGIPWEVTRSPQNCRSPMQGVPESGFVRCRGSSGF